MLFHAIGSVKDNDMFVLYLLQRLSLSMVLRKITHSYLLSLHLASFTPLQTSSIHPYIHPLSISAYFFSKSHEQLSVWQTKSEILEIDGIEESLLLAYKNPPLLPISFFHYLSRSTTCINVTPQRRQVRWKDLLLHKFLNSPITVIFQTQHGRRVSATVSCSRIPLCVWCYTVLMARWVTTEG